MDKLPIILDNGAYTAKVGLSTDDDPKLIPNCVMKAKSERRRAFVGNQIEECRDASGLFYLLPFQRGYLVNWDVQKSVWNHIFSKDGIGETLEDRAIVITQPQMNFNNIRDAMLEVLYEEHSCSAVHLTTSALLAAQNYVLGCKQRDCIVVDVGYSFTHIIPFVGVSPVTQAIRRIDVGGKFLTNYLKETISYRHLNVMDETHVVNQIKEDVCFVSSNFKEDMRVHSDRTKRSQIAVDYVLPDYTNVNRGYVLASNNNNVNSPKTSGVRTRSSSVASSVSQDQQIVTLCNERFTVPELLFNPSDVGLKQVGIPEAIMDSIKKFELTVQYDLLRHIIVIGGSSLFPNFSDRLKADLTALAPDDFVITIFQPTNPITYSWHGGRELANSENFEDIILTKQFYQEHGYVRM